MLQLILDALPAPAHRQAMRLGHALRCRWLRLTRPVLVAARVLALSPAGEVLLVRHTYGPDYWMLPGGGLKRREDPTVAALRELAEEAGCQLHDAAVLTLLVEPYHGAENRVHLVRGTVHTAPRADGREIREARLFARDALPANIQPGLPARLAGWLGD